MLLKYSCNNKLIVLINIINSNKNSNELFETIKLELDLLIEELYFEEISIKIRNNSIIISNKLEDTEDLKDIVYLLNKLQTTLLLKGILISGAITIAESSRETHNFSEKLEKNFKVLLKENKAIPRIILSKELETYLDKYNNNHVKEYELEFDEFNLKDDIYGMNYLNNEKQFCNTVEEIKYLLKLDRDKVLYIDYLKECLNDYLEAEKDYIKCKKEKITDNSFDSKSHFYDYYFENIIVEIKKVIFNGLNNNTDINIILKYLWLKDYYNTTLHILCANNDNKAYINE